MWAIFGLRRGHGLPYLRRFQRATKEHADFKKRTLRTHEAVAGLAREHDRIVRGVDSLLAQVGRGFPEPLPGFLQVLGQVGSQCAFGRGPTVVWLALSHFLLAVVTASGMATVSA